MYRLQYNTTLFIKYFKNNTIGHSAECKSDCTLKGGEDRPHCSGIIVCVLFFEDLKLLKGKNTTQKNNKKNASNS